jgi:hypothetical protein
MSGRKFTWANSRRVPTYERPDKVLVSTEWEQNYPLAQWRPLTEKFQIILLSC